MDLKQTYEKFLSEDAATGGKATRDTILDRLSAELAPLEQFDVAMNDIPADVDIPIRQLIGRCIELRHGLPVLSQLERERLPNYAEWWTSREQIARYEAALGEIQADRIAAHHPLSVLSPRLADEERPFELVLQSGEEIERLFGRLEETLGKSGVPREQWTTLVRARALIDYARRVQPVSQIGQMKLLDAESATAKEFRDQVKQLRSYRKELDDARATNKAWRQKLPAAEVPHAIEHARAFEASFFAWLKPAWWRLRGVMNRSYDFRSHVVRPSWTRVLEGLLDEYKRLQRFQDHEAVVARKVGIEGQVEELVGQIADLQESVAGLPGWLRRIHQALLKSDKARQIVTRTAEAHDVIESLRAEIAKIGDDFEEVSLEVLRRRFATALDSLDDLPDYLHCLSEIAALPPALSSSLRCMPHAPMEVEAAVADKALEDVQRLHRQLTRFNSGTRHRHASRLEKLYDHWQKVNAQEVRSRVQRRFLENIHTAGLPAAQLTAEQKAFKKRYNSGRRKLEHELGKSMRYKPIRDLVTSDSGEVVKDLKPVWLMSPLSVSDTLPLDTSHFDVVIFDEASQITLEEAVPSVFRATQAIVVGDEMQLPPTDFFSTKRTDEDEELFIEEAGELVQYDLESNSFLNHAAKNLPSTMLGWHYRSRSESLISFSNWTFYDGRLLTVPEERLADAAQRPIRVSESADGEKGAVEALNRSVSFHYVENGLYDKRRNRNEAEYIAHVVRKLLKDEAGVTIGIVAFSEAQQDEIEVALQRLAQDDKEFANLLDAETEREEDGQFVGLLVKNLENIQGDERDIIILSVCYGYGPSKKMRMNFGPINKSGGEKRLNVAFSRAKHHMALVSSIQHADITNDYNDGANCLKQYLRYAEAVSEGSMEVASRILHGMSRWHDATNQEQVASDVVAEQLTLALTRRGYRVDQHVGQSHFRCDLAVRRDGDAEYRLGILVDGPAYYDQSNLIERDMMRPRLLRDFGWKITHVLAKDWYAAADDCLEKIIALLEGEEEEVEDDDPILNDEAPAPVQMTTSLANSPSQGGEPTQVDSGVDLASLAGDEHAGDNRSTPADALRKYLEYRGGTSQKFWEITLCGAQHTVRFGRIGAQGQSRTKSFADEATANRDYKRLIREKLAKGYEEQ